MPVEIKSNKSVRSPNRPNNFYLLFCYFPYFSPNLGHEGSCYQKYNYYTTHNRPICLFFLQILTMDYSCKTCGANSCKLWRPYGYSNPLQCCICVAKEENVDINTLDENGMVVNSWGNRTDQIGGYMPAIPCEEEGVYWSYTCVPEDKVEWWRKLDTYPKIKELNLLRTQ